MDILALHLSPRKNGNSAAMLEEFLKGARSTGASAESYSVTDLKIHPCIECGQCEKTGECIFDDDMNKLYPTLTTTKKIVISTSLFFYDVPAQGKALIDRTQPLWSRRYSLKQTDTLRPDGLGFLLAVGATKGQDLFLPVTLCVKYFFDSIGFPKEFESLCFRQLEAADDFVKRPDLIEQIFAAGQAFGKKQTA
ncbi:flavodoxin family protein [Deltaproteobacteria bacterium Smac51]|nr:flavodoxin family protein [Deltaproteobacteria bacterium Smac51]